MSLEPRPWKEFDRDPSWQHRAHLEDLAYEQTLARLDAEDRAEEDRLAWAALERNGYDPVCPVCGRLSDDAQVCHNCEFPPLGPPMYEVDR